MAEVDQRPDVAEFVRRHRVHYTVDAEAGVIVPKGA